MKTITIILILLSGIAFAQTDWQKWSAQKISYAKQAEAEKQNLNSALGIARAGYKFLISDLDGDNCPFHPTCSQFFVEAVNETNFLKGLLMFADRFTRDANLYKTKYPLHKSGKFYDPVKNYLLDKNRIEKSSVKIDK